MDILCNRLAFLLFLIKTLIHLDWISFSSPFSCRRPENWKNQSIQTTVPCDPSCSSVPKVQSLEAELVRQSKPTTPEKTDLTNGEHARSGSLVFTRERHATRERGLPLSGTAPCASLSPSDWACLASKGPVEPVWCHDRKPPVSLLFLGLPLTSLWFSLMKHSPGGRGFRSCCQLWVFWLCFFFWWGLFLEYI